MIHYFIVPGYGGSGEKHWQSYFETSQPNFQRIEQKDWNHPNIDEWVEKLDKVISNYEPSDVVLVAHSLGCLTVALWAQRYKRKVKAALLVAPPDDAIIQAKIDFNFIPDSINQPIYFPTTLVVSTNDPWASLQKVKSYAKSWGSELINIGEAGHINADSGHYQWHEGLKILKKISA